MTISEQNPDSDATFLRRGEGELIDFVKGRIARSKAPHVVFGDLPRTSTGKIQKFVLRETHRR